MRNASPTDEELERALLELLAQCGPGKSICPSQIPRRLMGETGAWRGQLKRVRALAAKLAQTDRIVILRHGKPVAASEARGVIRLAQGAAFVGCTRSEASE